jgi:hypothetical protein
MQRAATKYGGELMGMGNELGLIKEGYLMLLSAATWSPM